MFQLSTTSVVRDRRCDLAFAKYDRQKKKTVLIARPRGRGPILVLAKTTLERNAALKKNRGYIELSFCLPRHTSNNKTVYVTNLALFHLIDRAYGGGVRHD